MLTLFSIPKAFTGAANAIQRRAVRSWTALGTDVQVVLVGDEPGVAAAASDLGTVHVPDVARSDLGTPRLDDAFARVEAIAAQPLRFFVNADIVLLDDFLPAVARCSELDDDMLMIGETVDLEVTDADLDDAAARTALRERARRDGRTRGPTAIDYFVFTPHLFEPMPPFVVGRARFDNWLVWRARRSGPVVDLSRAVVALHQPHDYGHLPGGLDEAHFGDEALRNAELAGGSRRAFTIHDASHVLRADGSIARNVGSFLRASETARKVAWKLGRR